MESGVLSSDVQLLSLIYKFYWVPHYTRKLTKEDGIKYSWWDQVKMIAIDPEKAWVCNGGDLLEVARLQWLENMNNRKDADVAYLEEKQNRVLQLTKKIKELQRRIEGNSALKRNFKLFLLPQYAIFNSIVSRHIRETVHRFWQPKDQTLPPPLRLYPITRIFRVISFNISCYQLQLQWAKLLNPSPLWLPIQPKLLPEIYWRLP